MILRIIAVKQDAQGFPAAVDSFVDQEPWGVTQYPSLFFSLLYLCLNCAVSAKRKMDMFPIVISFCFKIFLFVCLGPKVFPVIESCLLTVLPFPGVVSASKVDAPEGLPGHLSSFNKNC